MGTPDKPDVYIQFYDEDITDWVDLLNYSKNFTIRDAGILKIPQASLLMPTPANMPEKYERLRISVNTTGTTYMPFYGRIAEIERNPILGGTKKYFNLIAYGLEKRLKNDMITWKYATEQAAHGDLWTYKSMIEDFLVLPDSGYDTNLTLDTDLGNILNYVRKNCDFTRNSLQDTLRIISETIGYDGYVWIDGSDAKLKYVGLGTLAASPATTLQDPFVRKPSLHETIDEIYNYILPWGGVELGYPTTPDMFTERAIAKYNPDIWEALDGETIVDTPSDPANLKTANDVDSATNNTLTDASKSWTTDEWTGYSVYIIEGKGAGQIRTISSNTTTVLTISQNWTENPDSTSDYQIFFGYNPKSAEEVTRMQLSRYCIKISKAGTGDFQIRFRIDRTGVLSIDLEKRYFDIVFWLDIIRSIGGFWKGVELRLTDTSGNRIGLSTATYISIFKIEVNGWRSIDAPTLTEEEIKDTSTQTSWTHQIGTTFNKNAVKYLDIIIQNDSLISTVYIDRFLFGGGLKIDPFQNPQYYPNYASTRCPASKDATSIGKYGVRVYLHDDRDINSFQRAQNESDRVLAVLKDPIKTVTVTKKGLEWLRPNQNVTLNSSSLGVSSETWRTVELQWDWDANYPVYCTARLVEQNANTPPVFAPNGEVPTRSIVPPMTWMGRPSHYAHRGAR